MKTTAVAIHPADNNKGKEEGKNMRIDSKKIQREKKTFSSNDNLAPCHGSNEEDERGGDNSNIYVNISTTTTTIVTEKEKAVEVVPDNNSLIHTDTATAATTPAYTN
eukprot:11786166-Ditylum_brightwellii.AAC.1